MTGIRGRGDALLCHLISDTQGKRCRMSPRFFLSLCILFLPSTYGYTQTGEELTSKGTMVKNVGDMNLTIHICLLYDCNFDYNEFFCIM